tara:strand:+ start:49 stop:756 length:708 start_codon:yes stop_codon:yes gene_type:complete
MALPKLESPTFELVLPSTNEKIKFRPFLVKEQKILLMAQESKNETQIADTVGKLVNACTFGKVDSESVPMFDIEHIFLQLRAKSVGETVELKLLCPDDNKTYAKTKINLEDVSVQMTADHTNVIKISDKVTITFKYPLLKDMKDIPDTKGEIDKVFELLNKCVHEIHFGDKVYNRVDMTNEELTEFMNSMSVDQLQEVMHFFNTMPKLRHTVKVTNPKTKVKSEVVLEGLQNFLE